MSVTVKTYRVLVELSVSLLPVDLVHFYLPLTCSHYSCNVLLILAVPVDTSGSVSRALSKPPFYFSGV